MRVPIGFQSHCIEKRCRFHSHTVFSDPCAIPGGFQKGSNGFQTGSKALRSCIFNVYFCDCRFQSGSKAIVSRNAAVFIPTQFFLIHVLFRAGSKRVPTGSKRVRKLCEAVFFMYTSVTAGSNRVPKPLYREALPSSFPHSFLDPCAIPGGFEKGSNGFETGSKALRGCL